MLALDELQNPETTVAAVVTPRGQGGIGVIQVVGPDAITVVDRVFHTKRGKELGATEPNSLRHGFVVTPLPPAEDALEVIDEAIVRVGDQQASWLGEPFVEVNCHGGIAAVQATLEALVAAGAQPARWADIPLRACIRGCIDRVQMEAWVALPSAKTELASAMLLEQFNGALSRAVVDALETARWATVAELLATAPLGIALCRPPRVVIAGRPNVGKSSLFNALLSEDRALVHEQPGTTRDYVSAFIDIGGVPFELVDTAGVREGQHLVETSGIELTKHQIEQADLALLVRDGSLPPTQTDADLANLTADTARLPVRAKADLLRAPECQPWPGLEVSALTGRGLSELERQILVATVGTHRPRCEGPVVFADRQQRCLELALAAGDKTELREALHSLLWAAPTVLDSEE